MLISDGNSNPVATTPTESIKHWRSRQDGRETPGLSVHQEAGLMRIGGARWRSLAEAAEADAAFAADVQIRARPSR
ncbi:MAG: hypothetical protein KDB01_26325 [Planctomycetaceae bacterium]|nr:hypothetical protein [Planctomycetaceae bacterium]